jgi:D-cysteine desulfhydrase
MSSPNFLETSPYSPPEWAKDLNNIPKTRVNLGRLPTPLYKWNVSLLKDLGVNWWIKRDDMTGFELGGNKVRKLEFLLADAKAKGADCVVTIGGIQSNHCRATAIASKYIGLEPFLILRVPNNGGEDIGSVGNLLFSRMIEANIRTVTSEDFETPLGYELLEELAAELRAQGRNPYIIPMGGSNFIGSWGYLNAVDEMQQQLGQLKTNAADADAANAVPDSFDHITFACGSGGTASGVGLACELSGAGSSVHPVNVCDSGEFFTDFIQTKIHNELVKESEEKTVRDVASYVHFIDGVGLGYAQSTDEEVEFIYSVSRESGILLDPVIFLSVISCFTSLS